jgi:hypothetical protein
MLSACAGSPRQSSTSRNTAHHLCGTRSRPPPPSPSGTPSSQNALRSPGQRTPTRTHPPCVARPKGSYTTITCPSTDTLTHGLLAMCPHVSWPHMFSMFGMGSMDHPTLPILCPLFHAVTIGGGLECARFPSQLLLTHITSPQGTHPAVWVALTLEGTSCIT